jgi:hypothetical protein
MRTCHPLAALPGLLYAYVFQGHSQREAILVQQEHSL